MNDWIGNIFYFGSPKDGFKVYPDLGAVSNVFDGYYSNTETDWILIARKSEDIIRYTYVKYGLLTALVDGRTGSCFGISIDFVNHYFTDLKVFQTEIFEKIWGAILSDGKLLETQESSGKVAFKSYDLRDVAPYLDEMSKKIREVIQDKKWSDYIRPAYEIPPANDSSVHGLHPESAPSAMSEYFRMYGAIKLSPKLPIETKSPTEKQKENSDNLEKRVGELTEQLRQKDLELQAVNQRLEKVQLAAKPLYTELGFATHTSQVNNLVNNSRSTNQPYEALSSANHKGQYSEKATHNRADEDDLSPRTRKILAIVAGIAILAALVFLGKVLISSEETNPGGSENTKATQPTSQPSASVASAEPLLIVRQNGKEIGILNERFFFEQARGKPIYYEADFKEALTSFLFQFSPEVRYIYKGKDELWNRIVELNPKSTKNLTEYLKRAPFAIESNADQQTILKDLVIFVRSS